jgi:hypothetical protein
MTKFFAAESSLLTSDKKKCEIAEQREQQKHSHVGQKCRPLVTGPTSHEFARSKRQKQLTAATPLLQPLGHMQWHAMQSKRQAEQETQCDSAMAENSRSVCTGWEFILASRISSRAP